LSARNLRAVASAVTGLAVLGGMLIGATGPALAADTSQVSVVHGIPGQPVDVYVNGSKTLSTFAPGTVAGPLDLAAGSYDIALTKPGEPISSAILTVNGVAVPAGKNLSVVAHLNAAGSPTLTPFVNDTSPIPAGKARLVVRHTAAAPAVDVRANGTTVFTGLTNPNEDQVDVDAGSVSADVVLAGTPTVVIGPATLTLAEGSSTIVYAIGSADQKTLALVVQTISGLGSAPSGVPAGTGGLADSGPKAPWFVLLGVGALLIAGGAVHLVHVRRQQRATVHGR
jgi:Domain of unknown function (DUF4397)